MSKMTSSSFRTSGNGASHSNNLPSAVSIEISQTCSVCAEFEPKFWAISSCGHKICWICSLRLRSLYGSKACPICKTQSDFVFIGRAKEEAAEFFTKKSKFPLVNESLSIAYGSEAVRSCCENLLLLQCPFNHSNKPNGLSQAGCPKHFKTKNELKRHVQSIHDLQVCEICLEHKKCFTVELCLYNRSSLQKHQRDVNHPRCQVCDRIFYSEDELAEHCRDAHELCHICQRTGRPNRHFLNYHKLEEHFGKEHFLCPEPLCRELKFIVFDNELEYKAHQAEVHLSHQKLQRSQQRQLQRLNISFSGGNTATAEHASPGKSSTSPSNSDPLKLTSDQRNQIATNLIYGEVTDDLANRLQSLSLYQNRNDEFIESILRASLHFNQKQVQDLFEVARAYQKNQLSGMEFILKIEKLMPSPASADSRIVIKVASGLSDLQLDEMRRQKLNVAISEYRNKCSSFPELSSSSSNRSASGNTGNNSSFNTGKPSSFKAAPWGKQAPSSASAIEEDEKEIDPFGFARKQSQSQSQSHSHHNNYRSMPPGFNTGAGGVKVLQILKSTPANSTPRSTNDPSWNPAMLLSQLAGGPVLKKTPKSGGTVKMTTFSSAAVGSISTTSTATTATSAAARKQGSNKLDEAEFPKLGIAPTDTPISNGNVPSIPAAAAITSAFFAPSDRDQLDSFTLGPDDKDSEPSQSHSQQQSSKKDKKKKNLVFKYGQKWDV